MAEMNTFYRYIRPVKFDQSRFELVTQARGGICLRFEQHPAKTMSDVGNKRLWFTFARCHDEDLFSKEVAKRIVDGRSNNLDDLGIPLTGVVGRFDYTNNTKVLCQGVIAFCLDPLLNPNASPKVQYLQAEMIDLGVALKNMIRSNEIEEQKAEQFKEAIAATQTSQRYLHASR